MFRSIQGAQNVHFTARPLARKKGVILRIATEHSIAYVVAVTARRPALTDASKRALTSLPRSSAAEDDAAEAVQRNTKKHAANSSSSNNLRPDDQSVRPIKHVLGEDHQMPVSRLTTNMTYFNHTGMLSSGVATVLPESSIMTSNTGIDSRPNWAIVDAMVPRAMPSAATVNT